MAWVTGRFKGGRYMYTYVRFVLLYAEQHNIVKQLSSNWVSQVLLEVNTHLPIQEKQET